LKIVIRQVRRKEAVMEKRKPRILIIEDDEYSSEALEHLLSAEGCEPMALATGVSGYRAARRLIPDVIVLDLNLPDIDGQRVLRKVRGNRALGHVPIVVLTGYTRDNIPAEVSVSADFLITKPASFDAVIQAIFKLLNERPAARAAR
jgi:CheY-like chemotaxis protein